MANDLLLPCPALKGRVVLRRPERLSWREGHEGYEFVRPGHKRVANSTCIGAEPGRREKAAGVVLEGNTRLFKILEDKAMARRQALHE